MTEERREYTVVTGKGYWGKGATALEAAKNANLRGKFVYGHLYRASRYVAGEINCTDMGGASWNYSDELTDDEMKKFHFELHASVCLAHGDMKIEKGEVIVKQVF